MVSDTIFSVFEKPPFREHQANTLGIGTKQQSFEAARGKAENVKGATAAEKDVRMIHAY